MGVSQFGQFARVKRRFDPFFVGFLTHLHEKKTDEIIDELRGEANDFGR
jgi:hypothetical protein